MDHHWSGAIIYEWIEEANDYGLVTYGDQTNALASIDPTVEIKRSGIPTPVTLDYSRLKSVWAAVTPSSVKFGAYRPHITPPPCPAFTRGTWEIDSSVELPPVGATFNQAAQRSINGGGGGSPTGASASASSSGAAATQGVNMEVELVGMSVALVAVSLGFAMFL